LFACSQGPKSGSAEITVSWTFTTALGYHHFIRRTTVSRQCLFCKLYSFVPRVSSAVPMTRDFPMGVCDAPNQILMTSEKSSIQPLLDSLYIHSWNSREYYLLPAGSARLSLVSVPWAGRLQPPPLGIIIPFVESIAPDTPSLRPASYIISSANCTHLSLVSHQISAHVVVLFDCYCFVGDLFLFLSTRSGASNMMVSSSSERLVLSFSFE
jgi:hypothetical protein